MKKARKTSRKKVSGKNNAKNNANILVILNFTLLGIVLLFLGYGEITIVGTELRREFSTCNGIEQFYSNTSFLNDYHTMDALYDSCYLAEENLSQITLTLLRPDEICTGKFFDCEDFSHAIICLGEKYGIRCEMYYQQTHAGAECFYEEQWTDFN